jgi:hypothetical protein
MMARTDRNFGERSHSGGVSQIEPFPAPGSGERSRYTYFSTVTNRKHLYEQ